MRSAYDFAKAVRSKYHKRYVETSNVAVIVPDVLEKFKNTAAVNEALRKLIQAPGKKRDPAKRPARTRAKTARVSGR